MPLLHVHHHFFCPSPKLYTYLCSTLSAPPRTYLVHAPPLLSFNWRHWKWNFQTLKWSWNISSGFPRKWHNFEKKKFQLAWCMYTLWIAASSHPPSPIEETQRATAQRVGQYFRRHSNDIPAGLLQHEVDVDRIPNNELTSVERDWHNNIRNFSTQNLLLLFATHSSLVFSLMSGP